jgi:hypothetical protein
LFSCIIQSHKSNFNFDWGSSFNCASIPAPALSKNQGDDLLESEEGDEHEGS